MLHQSTRLAIWGLMALMAATRFHHFGDFQTLPDASWAVFFLAGLFVPHAWGFALLLLEAGLIDWIATQFAGISDWCITPAYLFLVPTYGVLWLAGIGCRRCGLDQAAGLIRALLVLTVAVGIAFTISNASFYLLSGYFGQLSAGDYIRRITGYFPSYLLTTLAYTSLVLAGRWLWRQWIAPAPQSTES